MYCRNIVFNSFRKHSHFCTFFLYLKHCFYENRYIETRMAKIHMPWIRTTGQISSVLDEKYGKTSSRYSDRTTALARRKTELSYYVRTPRRRVARVKTIRSTNETLFVLLFVR